MIFLSSSLEETSQSGGPLIAEGIEIEAPSARVIWVIG
jgi:hypothetical protein